MTIFNKKKRKKNRIRLGRGQGSGKGGTCGRGHKGAKSRSGFSNKIGFEGGQMPLHKRIPKFGFKNNLRKKFIEINLDTIQDYINKKKINKKDIFCIEMLIKKNITKKNIPIKIIGRGIIHDSIKIFVNKISKKAKNIIENAGGKVLLRK
ncbi:50S ribosomal protein L15 [Blattabacterium cuenoti]|uniref:50S ribosomal protein L15 n=1 Tax=Blattabacterium cuenoti TaxID=1653831 RepID=UPI001EEBE1C2|nr:50S ribosomal protein L15 [Blattabacterium cuenoti]